MTDATLLEVMDALADQLLSELEAHVDDLQVEPRMMFNPTDPAIDIYPDDPFQEPSGFRSPSNLDTTLNFVVRARVSTVDREGAQDALLAMMDPNGAASVAKAVESDPTFSGAVQEASCGPPSNFAAFVEPGGRGALLGCTWTVTVIL